MPIYYAIEVEIDRPRAAVIAAMLDPRVLEAVQPRARFEGSNGVPAGHSGEVQTYSSPGLFGRQRWTSTVVASALPDGLLEETDAGGFLTRSQTTFKELGTDRTRLTQRSTIELRPWQVLEGLLFRVILRSQTAKLSRRLVAAIEDASTPTSGRMDA